MYASAGSDALSELAGSFAAADSAGQSSTHRYDIADAPVVFRFAGDALRAALSPAFGHLASSSDDRSAPPALTVHLWDSASSGAPAPLRPTAPDEYAEGALVHFAHGSLRGVYAPATETLSALDLGSGVGWHWLGDVSNIPHWDRARPLRQMLCWWLQFRGYLQLHGSAVGTAQGGVLMAGKSGSGKSMTSLSVLGSTLLFAADDYCAMQVEGSPRIISLYSSGTLVPEEGRRLLPHLMPLASNPDRLATEKAVIFAHQHFPSQTTHGFPLRAILIPTVRATRRASRVVEISRAAAFAALAPSTIVQMRTPTKEALNVISELVRQVPSYGFEVGADTASIPGTISDFLERGTPSA
jgi:hypothetical protein